MSAEKGASRGSKRKLGSSADAPFPVSRAIGRVQALLRSSIASRYWFSGEVIELRKESSGTTWFSLQHDGCRIGCVVWATSGATSAPAVQNGMRVAVYAQLKVYERSAGLQLVVAQIRLDGAGEAKRRLEEVRQRLMRDGLLDPRRKRSLPEYPRAVAVVTSPTGAALHDIVAVARRRHPGIQLRVIPTTVQGPHVATGVIRALGIAQRARCDVVIIARGGGSPAELDTFSDEGLARAIAASRIPVVVAIGHERDRVLAEDVADLRAGTPSIAAERVIPERRQMAATLAQLSLRARQALDHRLRRADSRLSSARTAVTALASTKLLRHHARIERSHADACRQLSARVNRSKSILHRRHADLIWLLTQRVTRERLRVDRLAASLAALDPTAVLERGYAILSDERGRVLSSVAEAQQERRLRIRMRDGDLVVHVPHKR